MTSKNFSPPN